MSQQSIHDLKKRIFKKIKKILDEECCYVTCFLSYTCEKKILFL